jgi:hypothetical protein
MQVRSTAVVPGSSILFCRCSQYGVPASFKILLKHQSGTDVVLLDESERLNPRARHWKKIANRIQSRYGIKTQLKKEITSASGLTEQEWSPAVDREHGLRIVAAIITSLFIGQDTKSFAGILV